MPEKGASGTGVQVQMKSIAECLRVLFFKKHALDRDRRWKWFSASDLDGLSAHERSTPTKRTEAVPQRERGRERNVPFLHNHVAKGSALFGIQKLGEEWWTQ